MGTGPPMPLIGTTAPGYFKENGLVSITQGVLSAAAAEGSCMPVQMSELKQEFYHEGTCLVLSLAGVQLGCHISASCFHLCRVVW